MELLNHQSEEMTLIIDFEGQKEELKCKTDDKMENILNIFISKISQRLSSFAVLYGGKYLSNQDLKISLYQIMSKIVRQSKKMNILLVKQTTIANPSQDQISITLIINSINTTILKGKREDKIKDIINKHSFKLQTNFNFSYFTSEDNEIDLNKNFNEVAKERDKILGKITLKVDTNSLRVYFINEKEEKVLINCDKKDKIKDACNNYCQRVNENLKYLSFKYGLSDANLEDNFEQLIYNSSNEQSNVDIRLETDESLFVGNNTSEIKNNEIELKVSEIVSRFKKHKILLIVISSILVAAIIALIVYFLTKKPDNEDNNKTDIIDSTSKTNEDNNKTDIIDSTNTKRDTIINTVYQTDTIKTRITCQKGYYNPDDDLTMEQCIKCSLERCSKCNGTYEYNECIDCGDLINVYNNSRIIKCNNTCETGSEEKCLTCYEDKIQCKSCNIGYKLVNGKCKPDFLIKAIYNTNKDGDIIYLFSSGSYSYLTQMIIEDEIIIPKYGDHEYQFQKAGNHTVYLKFRKASGYSSKEGFFSNKEKLISVTFSDFNEYLPDIALSALFSGCSNLIEVDLSKMVLDYSYKTSSMFAECVSLKKVNMVNKKYNINTITQKMFLNCRSLISLDLSNFDVTKVTDFQEMFSGCSSLQSINLKNFRLNSSQTYINDMFKNCYSLKSLDLSSFQPKHIKKMSNLFYNCYSLTSINISRLSINQVTDLSYLFYNCHSLKYIDLSGFNTEAVTLMDNMFESCYNLTSINFGYDFTTNKVIRMNSLFSHCHSLTRIDLPSNFIIKMTNLTAFFSDCHSLTSIDLSNFNNTYPSNSLNMNYMFRNCYSLKYINFSNIVFCKTNNMNYMFSGCYSLTSLNFLNANNVSSNFDGIFFNCPNLTYINFSFVNNSYSNNRLFNDNISEVGTLILNVKYYTKSVNNYKPPKNWTLILY